MVLLKKGSILITGGTTGLGYATALQIAQQYPEYIVVIASRTDKGKAADSINDIISKQDRKTNVQYMSLDLSDLANVRKFAEDWSARKFPLIEVLFFNAALQFPNSVEKTQDGTEKTFAIAHVGHALLFHLLLPSLKEDARIVMTSSGTHDPAQKTGLPDAVYTTAEELAHPTAETEKYAGRQRYASSKLANVLWTYALHQKLQTVPRERKKTVVAFDPGMMPGTGLARDAGPVLNWVWCQVFPRMLPLLRRLISPNIHTAQESAAALIYVGLDSTLGASSEVMPSSGKYFEGKKEIPSSKDSYDKFKQQDLWDWTVRFISTSEEEREKFDKLQI